MSDVFEKHTYGKTRKRTSKLAEDFDTRPLEYRGTTKDRFPALLDKLHRKERCISLLLDPRYHHWDTASSSTTISSELPDNAQLKSTIVAFMEILKISTEKAREIEQDTSEQHHSSLWFAVRHYRNTASLFGNVLQRRQGTPPDNLVFRILQEK